MRVFVRVRARLPQAYEKQLGLMQQLLQHAELERVRMARQVVAASALSRIEVRTCLWLGAGAEGVAGRGEGMTAPGQDGPRQRRGPAACRHQHHRPAGRHVFSAQHACT